MRRQAPECRPISRVSVTLSRSGCSFSLEQQSRAVYQYPSIFLIYDSSLSAMPGLDCICILRMRQPNPRCQAVGPDCRRFKDGKRYSTLPSSQGYLVQRRVPQRSCLVSAAPPFHGAAPANRNLSPGVICHLLADNAARHTPTFPV